LSFLGPSLSSDLILDRISDGFFVLDGQWRFTQLNRRAGGLAPRRPDALVGKSIWKAFPETVGTIVCTEFHRAVEHKVPVCFPYYSNCLERCYEVKAYPFQEGLTVFFHDATLEYEALEGKQSIQRTVTFRAEVSSALSKHDTPLDAILRECAESVVRHAGAALAQIWLVDEAQNKLELHASAGMCAHHNNSHSPIPVGTLKIGFIASTGQPVLTNTAARDPSICNRQWARRRGIISFAGYPLSLGSKVIGVMAMFACHRLREDVLDDFACVAAAISQGIDRKRTEQALRDSEETLRLAAEATELGTWNWDIPTDTLTANARTRLIFGLPPNVDLELFLEMIHPDDRKRVEETIARSIDPLSAGNYDIEYRIVRQDGAVRWVKEKGKVSFKGNYPDRVPVRFVGTVIDSTDEKRKEEELREAVRAKDEFLATLSHELRTPLTAIHGWASLLHTGRVKPSEVTKAYEVIERNVKAQTQLVDDLLNVSRIILGKVKLAPKWLDPTLIIDAAVESIRPAAVAKGLNIHTQSDGPSLIFADPDRLQQVIYNLLSNALKFTDKGGDIQIDFGRVDDMFHINVRDTGEGISPEFLPFVFDQFRQADASTTRKHGGLGLGLSIVRHITELHGGTVVARSEGKGKGATMTVQLPFPEPPPDSAHAKSEPDFLQGMTVMVIENEPETLCKVGEAVQEYGASVILASSAAEALAQLNHKRPDVLISDVSMAETNAFELIRKIRSWLPGESEDIPAVALSAAAGADDRNKSLQAGYRAHITKPVAVQDLVSILAELTRRKHDTRVHGD
jgi:PAS domain S-box-containing protein